MEWMQEDIFGNQYTPITGSTYSYTLDNTAGGSITIDGASQLQTGQLTSWPLTGNGVNITGVYDRYTTPNAATLTPGAIEALAEKMVTLQKPGEKMVICVDHDATTTQVRELHDMLIERGIKNPIIIRGARAGTGFLGNILLATEEDKRVDVLARIGEVWAQRPDLKLTDLLQWYAGEEMENEDFATAVEVHYMKITNGVFGAP